MHAAEQDATLPLPLTPTLTLPLTLTRCKPQSKTHVQVCSHTGLEPWTNKGPHAGLPLTSSDPCLGQLAVALLIALPSLVLALMMLVIR